MKIKAICEITGLSDRTIRYYIEEGLVSPSYTENYLGRKNYDFTNKDIDELNNITVLRKFDFTIAEIKTIINDVESSRTILAEVKERTEATVLNGQEKLAVLSQIDTEQSYSVEELAKELSKPALALPIHNEKVKTNIPKILFSLFKAIIITVIVWLPILLSLFVVIIDIRNNHYPVFSPKLIIATIVSLLPSIMIMVIPKIKKFIKRILLVLCILCIPVSFILSFGVVSRSETTDFRNYRDFDADCLANKSMFFQELFPLWPHYFVNVEQPDGNWEAVYLDAHYFYRNLPAMDYTYDIYAEWPLEKEAFDAEVARVQALYENDTNNYYAYDIVKKGNYTCLFRYNGDPPFEEVSWSYTYYIFAYDEQNLTVRYILCDSLENGVDQPYYLSLDW